MQNVSAVSVSERAEARLSGQHSMRLRERVRDYYPELTFFSAEEELQLLNGSCPQWFRTFGLVTSVNTAV